MTLPSSQPNWFDFSEVGIPTLNNVAGSLLEAIRACAVNGFNSRVVTSIVVAGGVATATAASHGYSAAYGKLLLVEGAPESLLNGRKQPLTVATNTFTFAAPGVADGTYTGTISAKRAPLGWIQPYSGTNKAIFARSVIESNIGMLRVDDAGATFARVIIVNGVTDVDTFTEQAPTQVQLAGGGYWGKGENNATAKPWCIVGNDRFFWLFSPGHTSASPGVYGAGAYYFGDLAGLGMADSYATVLAAAESYGSAGLKTSQGALMQALSTAPTSYARVSLRAQTGSVGAARLGQVGITSNGSISGHPSFGQISSDRIVISMPVYAAEETTFLVRGTVPGFATLMARAPFAGLGSFALIDPIAGEQKRFLSVLCSAAAAESNLLIDLTGPWH